MMGTQTDRRGQRGDTVWCNVNTTDVLTHCLVFTCLSGQRADLLTFAAHVSSICLFQISVASCFERSVFVMSCWWSHG